MCGIAGIFTNDRQGAARAAAAMNVAQRHRGPDDEGVQLFDVPAGSLALAHRRLAIIDLSPAGHQPMSNPETGDWIVFNGEIYNFLELRAELEKLGETFRSRSDTEVILKAFARWGESSFKKLSGMFAFAIFSKSRNELLLVRDPLGIKPLYVVWRENAFAFASETRALKAAGLVDGKIDRRAVAGMIAYGAVQEPLTMYESVKSIAPGAWAALDLSSPRTRSFRRTGRHWDFPNIHEPAGGETGALQSLRETLRASATSHLISDVPVGIFLSSGIDSTAVAALCAQSRRDLDAFSVRLADRPELDESADAAISAKALGMRHHILELSETATREQTQNWIAAQDQPSMDGLNTYVISKAVRERGIVVALSGLGGDEIFGGYPSFRDVPKMMRWRKRTRFLPAPLLKLAARAAFANRSQTQRQKAVDMAVTGSSIVEMYMRRRRLASEDEMRALGFDARKLNLTPEFLPPESEPERGLPASDPAAAIAILECRFYMSGTLLRDSDGCGMAHSLEIRVPLLDRRVLDCALALPGSMRVPAQKAPFNKPMLVRALDGILPEHILNLYKRGFNLSQPLWMAGPLRGYFDSAISALEKSGMVERASAQKIWNQFLSGGTGPDWARPWTLGVLGAWCEANR